MTRTTVLLADDHRLVAEGIRLLLEPEFDLVGIVEDGKRLVEEALRLRPDVIVADISMPEMNGIDALVQLRSQGSKAKVVFLTMHREVSYARRALDAGAAGVVLKHSATEVLLLAIRAALAGEIFVAPELTGDLMASFRQDPTRSSDPSASLTPRQREILVLLADGKTAKEIGASLGISARTVEFHKYEMMQTLELHTLAELVRFAIRNGISTV